MDFDWLSLFYHSSLWKCFQQYCIILLLCYSFDYFWNSLFSYWSFTIYKDPTSPRISQPARHERCCGSAAFPPFFWASAPSAAWRWRPANHVPQTAPNPIGCHWAHLLYRPIAFREKEGETLFKHANSAYKQDKTTIEAQAKTRQLNTNPSLICIIMVIPQYGLF